MEEHEDGDKAEDADKHAHNREGEEVKCKDLHKGTNSKGKDLRKVINSNKATDKRMDAGDQDLHSR